MLAFSLFAAVGPSIVAAAPSSPKLDEESLARTKGTDVNLPKRLAFSRADTPLTDLTEPKPGALISEFLSLASAFGSAFDSVGDETSGVLGSKVPVPYSKFDSVGDEASGALGGEAPTHTTTSTPTPFEDHTPRPPAEPAFSTRSPTQTASTTSEGILPTGVPGTAAPGDGGGDGTTETTQAGDRTTAATDDTTKEASSEADTTTRTDTTGKTTGEATETATKTAEKVTDAKA